MNDNTVLGASNLPTKAEEFKSSLDGVGEERVVGVFNPLPHDFRVIFARTQTAQVPANANLQYAREKAGLPLEKGNPVQNFTHEVILKAKTIQNLPGDIAQKATRDLTSFIIQTRNDDGTYDFSGHGGNKGLVADPFTRKQVEQEIVKGIKNAMDFFNQPSGEDYTNKQIEDLNNPVTEEPTDVPNPAPGTGFNYTPKASIPPGTGQSDSAQPGADKGPENPTK